MSATIAVTVQEEGTSTPLEGVGVEVTLLYPPPLTGNAQRFFALVSPGGIWDALTDAEIAEIYDAVRFHTGTINRIDGIRAEAATQGRTLKYYLYELPMMALTSMFFWNDIPSESYFLHNPDGSANSTDRVRFQSGASLRYLMDFRSATVRNWFRDQLMNTHIVPKNLDGFFNDSAGFSTRNKGTYVVAPTDAQRVEWLDAMVLWVTEMKAAMGANRIFLWNLIDNFMLENYADYSTSQWQATLNEVNHLYLETWPHSYGDCLDELKAESNLDSQLGHIQTKALDAGKSWSTVGGTQKNFQGAAGACDGPAGTQADYDRWRIFSFCWYLLKVGTTGKDLFSWRITGVVASVREETRFLKNLNVGMPTAAAFTNPAWNWERDFTLCRVRANTSKTATREGILPQRGRIDFDDGTVLG